MADKRLRRCLRSGIHFFFHRRSHHSADRQLLQQLYTQKLRPVPAIAPSSITSMAQPHSASNDSAPCLSLPGGGPCFPASHPVSSASTPRSSSEEAGYFSADESSQQLGSIQGKQLLARSHSCSKLQCSFTVRSFKSLRPTSRSDSRAHLQHGRHSPSCSSGSASDEVHACASSDHHFRPRSGASLKYTRSWSAPSLRRISCLAKGKHGGSFHGELHAGGNVQMKEKGKRAPKGHVVLYVDGGGERYAVPIAYLGHPYFQDLLQRTESEFGFAQKGGLLLPCSLSELEETLARIASSKEGHDWPYSSVNH